jgi:hypothetical protein
MRILIGCLALEEGVAFDLNTTPQKGAIASARAPFDHVTLIDSGLLTADEIDRLRPRVYERWEELDEEEDAASIQFIKVHDAYSLTPLGEPLLAGRRAAMGAILIVRDPRDVAASLANHNQSTLDAAIDLMNDVQAADSKKPARFYDQLPQKLWTWSAHAASWLNQADIPVHLVRYEDLKQDTAGVFRDAMSFAGRAITQKEAERAARMADFHVLQDQERVLGFSEKPPKAKVFFRRGETQGWRDELTALQVERLESAHETMMERLGYTMSGPTVRQGEPEAARARR